MVSPPVVSTISHSLSTQISIYIPEPPVKYFNHNNLTDVELMIITCTFRLENTAQPSLSSFICPNFLEIDSRWYRENIDEETNQT